MTLVIAHRGAWSRARGSPAENTLEAFEAAIELGVDMIELDVRRTRDGQLIVYHDARVKAVPTSSLRYEAVRIKGTRSQPPLLADVLALAKDRIALDLEVKEPGYVEETIALLRSSGFERCVLTSFLDEVVREAKMLAPELRTGLLIATGLRRALATRLPASKADYLGLHRRLADATGLGRVADAGVPCLIWTVNGARAMDRLLGHPAVEGVITDRPALALERRARLAPHDGGVHKQPHAKAPRTQEARMAEHELREQVALGCRILATTGHDDFVWGHVSARDPAGRGMWMKASTFAFEEITAEHVILVGFDGEVLAGEHPRHVEWPIHTGVLRARPDIGGVVHSHPPHSIAIGASGQPLLPVSHAGTMFVPPDVPRFTRTAELIVTPELGTEVASALGPRHALFLVNHGIVTAGSDVRDAVIRAVLLEKAAHQQLLVHGFGGAQRWSSEGEALRKRATVWSEGQLAALWDYLVRRVERGR